MKTIKDLIFMICAALWVASNALSFHFFAENGLAISNVVCIVLFGTMTLVKMKYRRFGLWLENDLRKTN